MPIVVDETETIGSSLVEVACQGRSRCPFAFEIGIGKPSDAARTIRVEWVLEVEFSRLAAPSSTRQRRSCSRCGPTRETGDGVHGGRSPRRPGDGMLHPVILIAVAILLTNDQLLKAAWPGPVTGKLSDIAGLVFFPALIVAVWEVATRRRPFAGPTPHAIGVAVVVTGLVFASVKSNAACAQLVATTVALLQWPFAVVLTAVQGTPAPSIGTPIRLVVDPTDLVVLPVLAIPLALGLRRAASVPAYGRGP